MECKVFPSFLEPYVQEKIQSTYGKTYFVKKDRILKQYKNYPYPKDIGYWFLKDDDLFVVINEQ